MANEYYDHTTYPADGSAGTASAMRSELDSIELGLDKLPTLASNGSKIIAVNSGATGLEAITTTGTGSGVRATSPTLVTPALGVATATTVNGLAITTSTGTLTITNGKTASVSNTLTFTGTDNSTVTCGAGGTVAYTGNNLSAFAATTSAQLAGVMSDETGSGALVFANTPTLTTPTIGVATATSVNKVTITAPATSATLTIIDGKTFTSSNTLTLTATDGSTLAVGTGGTLGTAAYTASSAYPSVAFTTLAVSGQSNVVADSTSDTLTLAAGTGITLTTNAGTDTVTIAGGGSLVLLATLTPTAAAFVDALSTFTSSYDNYLIIGGGIEPASSAILRIQFATGGIVDASGSYYGATDNVSDTTLITQIELSTPFTSGVLGGGFFITIRNANDSVNAKILNSFCTYENAATPSFIGLHQWGAYSAANAISGVRFSWDGSVNFAASGKIRIYGYANS